MNYASEIYFNTCKEFGLNVQTIEDYDGFVLNLGKEKYFFEDGHVPFNSFVSVYLANNKYAANQTLAEHGFPVPQAMFIDKAFYESQGIHFDADELPVVVKPALFGIGGQDVTCNITDNEQLKIALDGLFSRFEVASIEEFVPDLNSYRVLVLDDEVIGVVERTPAHVVGDGSSTIQELIDERDKAFAQRKQRPFFFPVEMNQETDFILKQRGYQLDSILKKDEHLPLRYACNACIGGTTKSLPTKTICKENARLAVSAAKTLGLHLAGLDILCEDISKPIGQTRGVIIEVNANPHLTVHENDNIGTPVKVSRFVIKKQLKQHPFEYAKYCFRRHWGKLAFGLLALSGLGLSVLFL